MTRHEIYDILADRYYADCAKHGELPTPFFVEDATNAIWALFAAVEHDFYRPEASDG